MSTEMRAAGLPSVSKEPDHWVARFEAMAGPCEIFIDCPTRAEAETAAQVVAAEAQRIEYKFSRYRADNIVYRINTANGHPVHVDAETAQMLDYAQTCYQLSDGLFDISSGILRRVWRFAPGATFPSQAQIDALLPLVGWQRVQWQRPQLQLQPGMEIDLGGIGKEYAVDRCAALLAQQGQRNVLINFGGDLYAIDCRADQRPWQIAIDDPYHSGERTRGMIELSRGGVATSGDARRFLMHRGKRYGHILDPKTGWPVADAPRSVTVIANTCLEAGLLATLAMLQGKKAEQFLTNEGLRFYCVR